MFKKFWKVIASVLLIIGTEILVVNTDLILENIETKENINMFLDGLFLKRFNILVLIIFIIAAFLFGSFIQELLNKNKESKTNSSKLTSKQKKFIKSAKSEIEIDGSLYKYDVDFLPGFTNPTACRLRYFNKESGLTEVVGQNGIFRGKDPNYLHRTAQSYLNTQWDEFNNK